MRAKVWNAVGLLVLQSAVTYCHAEDKKAPPVQRSQRVVSGVVALASPTTDKDPKAPKEHKYIPMVAVGVSSFEGSNKADQAPGPELTLSYGADGFSPRVAALSGRTHFLIKNTTGGPIYVRAVSTDTELTVAEFIEGMANLKVDCKAEKRWTVIAVDDVPGGNRGWIFVTPNSFAAVTDKNGEFRISGLPPGKYTLQFWHPAIRFHRIIKRQQLTIEVKDKDVSLDPILITQEDVTGPLEVWLPKTQEKEEKRVPAKGPLEQK